MSELNERRWAVLSERGCEDSGLTYSDAAGLIARLRAERVSGLCVITDAAAAHVPRAQKPAENRKPADNAKPKRTRKKSTA